MYQVRIDAAQNRLYITLIGFLPPEEMTAWSNETIAAAKKLKAGFDVVIDLTRFKPTTPEGTASIERVQSFFKIAGARRGIQVVGDNVLGGLQFKRMSVRSGFDPTNVATLIEAERLLAGKV